MVLFMCVEYELTCMHLTQLEYLSFQSFFLWLKKNGYALFSSIGYGLCHLKLIHLEWVLS